MGAAGKRGSDCLVRTKTAAPLQYAFSLSPMSLMGSASPAPQVTDRETCSRRGTPEVA